MNETNTAPWRPHVTVATIVEKDGKFLLVEEICHGKRVLNQPAGHLEPKETLIEAAHRETLEETGWDVKIEGVCGVSLYRSPNNGVTYARTLFFASPIAEVEGALLDDDIIAPHWLTLDEIQQKQDMLRSPLVLKSIDHYLSGHRYPLSILLHLID